MNKKGKGIIKRKADEEIARNNRENIRKFDKIRAYYFSKILSTRNLKKFCKKQFKNRLRIVKS